MATKAFTIPELIDLLGRSYYFVAKTDNVYNDKYKNLTIRKDEYGISGSVCGYILASDLQNFIDSSEFNEIVIEEALTYLKTMN